MTLSALQVWCSALLLGCLSTAARADDIVLPSDVAVSLTATPTQAVEVGEPIAFTVAIRNTGTDTVPFVFLASTPFVDQFVLHPIENDCDLTLSVSDGPDDFFYELVWIVTGYETPEPLEPGETRTCHFQLVPTSRLPASFAFGMGLTGEVDPDPSNDSASVDLIRAGTSAQPVPSNATWAQLCLALALMALGLWKRNPTYRQGGHGHGRTPRLRHGQAGDLGTVSQRT